MPKNHDLQELRALLHAEPSEEAWSAICTCIENQNKDVLEVGLDYAAEHLTRWPDELRLWTSDSDQWQRPPRPWWPLVRHACFEGHDDIDMGEVGLVLNARNVRHLTMLDLSHNKIGTEGARMLARNTDFRHLTHLDLSHNHIRCEGALALTSAAHLDHQPRPRRPAWLPLPGHAARNTPLRQPHHRPRGTTRRPTPL